MELPAFGVQKACVFQEFLGAGIQRLERVLDPIQIEDHAVGMQDRKFLVAAVYRVDRQRDTVDIGDTDGLIFEWAVVSKVGDADGGLDLAIGT